MNEAYGAEMRFRHIDVLDHGYLALVETWGSEEGIIEAARMSTGKGFLGWGPKEGTCSKCGLLESTAKLRAVNAGKARDFCDDGVSVAHDFKREPGDEKLLRFLWENKHATPFEMAGATIEVQAPIFVFREWHRHRTQSYNEMSARYTPLPDVNYIPSVERLLINSKTNKQAGVVAGAAELDERGASNYRRQLEDSYVKAEELYQWALRQGVPKELARIHLPVGRYSRMRASTDLRNWLAFLTLREAPGAQWEIRQYANTLHALLKEKFPRTLSLFEEKP
jgi:thymidylate synthase (FAD)